MALEKKYYVYEHWRPDKNVCFYVGKGKGTRAFHLNQSRSRIHRALLKRLIAKGVCIEVKIVGFRLTEKEAYHLEKIRILNYRNQGIKLVNMTNGGLGGKMKRTTPATSGNANAQRKDSNHR